MESTFRSQQHRRSKKTPPGQPRARPINSCLTCRDRKKGCDKRQPMCGNCMQNPNPSKPCVYAYGKADVLKAHKQKMQSLKEALAASITNGITCKESNPEEDPVRNPLIFNDSAFEEDVEDDNADLGICLGKLRISDRIGGLFRPSMVEELTNALDYSAQRYPEDTIVPDYIQPLSSFIEPGPMFVTPRIYHMIQSPGSDADCPYLPDKYRADLILSQYWERVHPVARVLHRHSFQERWVIFWETRFSGEKCEKSLLALVFTVLFSGLVSTPDDVDINMLKYDKQSLMEQVRAGMEIALARSSWIRSTKVEMLQAVVIYLISVCRKEVSCAHSNIVAAAIRAAECIGLHKDSPARSYSTVQIQVRRLLWYQLLLLDIRTCEATGPRPQIRKGDFSTKLPLNVDEHVVHLSANDSKKWTDMSVTIIRIRCNEFIREIWTDRMRLQEKQVTIGEILDKIQAFDAHMQGKYGKMADMNVPIQRYGCLIAKILTLRTYAMILHQYALHPEVEMPDTLKKMFIEYGVETMDAVQDLETAPDLALWRWLAGAIQQHHYALAMLLEFLKDPSLSQAVGLLRGIDYVFEPPQHLGLRPLARVRCVVVEMRNRMRFYVAQRKPRALKSLHDSGELLSSEDVESSTSSSPACASITPREASLSPKASKSIDDQSAGTASTYFSLQSSKQMLDFSANEKSKNVDLSQQTGEHFQEHFMDLDMPSLKQHSSDIVNLDVTMGSEYVHKASVTGGYSPDVSQQSQLPVQWTANNGYLYYAPQFDKSSNAPIGERGDERAENCQDESTNIHYRNDAIRRHFLPAPPPALEMPASTHTITLPTYCSAMPSSNFLSGPATQTDQDLPVVMQEPQQGQLFLGPTAPFSDSNTPLYGGQGGNWYTSHGSVSVLQGAFNTQGAHHESYGRQKSDWTQCDVPAAFLSDGNAASLGGGGAI